MARYVSFGECQPSVEASNDCVGVKKAANRGVTSLMMKTGHVERTNDRNYEAEERRYRTMEMAANKLQLEARGYLDSLRGESLDARLGALAATFDARAGTVGCDA